MRIRTNCGCHQISMWHHTTGNAPPMRGPGIITAFQINVLVQVLINAQCTDLDKCKCVPNRTRLVMLCIKGQAPDQKHDARVVVSMFVFARTSALSIGHIFIVTFTFTHTQRSQTAWMHTCFIVKWKFTATEILKICPSAHTCSAFLLARSG